MVTRENGERARELAKRKTVLSIRETPCVIIRNNLNARVRANSPFCDNSERGHARGAATARRFCVRAHGTDRYVKGD